MYFYPFVHTGVCVRVCICTHVCVHAGMHTCVCVRHGYKNCQDQRENRKHMILYAWCWYQFIEIVIENDAYDDVDISLRILFIACIRIGLFLSEKRCAAFWGFNCCITLLFCNLFSIYYILLEYSILLLHFILFYDSESLFFIFFSIFRLVIQRALLCGRFVKSWRMCDSVPWRQGRDKGPYRDQHVMVDWLYSEHRSDNLFHCMFFTILFSI